MKEKMSDNRHDWNSVVANISSEFSADMVTIHRFNSQDEHLYLVIASECIPEQVRSVIQRIPLGKGIAGAAAFNRKPTTICNLQTDQSGVAKPGAKATKAGGSLCVPVLSNQELLGTLGIGYYKECDFTEEEINKLTEYGEKIAPMLME